MVQNNNAVRNDLKAVALKDKNKEKGKAKSVYLQKQNFVSIETKESLLKLEILAASRYIYTLRNAAITEFLVD